MTTFDPNLRWSSSANEEQIMSSEFSPLEGGCRCGQVRFRIAAPPVITMACHCTGCQRMSASAFSLSAVIPSVAFLVTQEEPVIGGLHGPTRHFSCPYCMSWMFTRPVLDESAGAPHNKRMQRTGYACARHYLQTVKRLLAR